MDPTSVPDTARQAYSDHVVVDMGPPPGVAEEDCGTAEMLLGMTPTMPGFAGRDQMAFFKPSPQELDRLIAGGYLVMNQIGHVVQPFSLGVWGPEEPATFVEIGGQRMTQAQFDAARAPLLGEPPDVELTRTCGGCGTSWTAPVSTCPKCGS